MALLQTTLCLFSVVSLLSSFASAQNTSDDQACLALFNNANATGQVSFFNDFANQPATPDLSNANYPLNNLTWAVTLDTDPDSNGSSGDTNYVNTLWLGTPANVDLDDGANPFSACTFLLANLTEKLLLRGQTDDGSCEQMFSSDCVKALQIKAAQVSLLLTNNFTPGPNSNLSLANMVNVCDEIRNQVGQPANFPSECMPFFNVSNPEVGYLDALTIPLTSNVSSGACAVNPPLQSNHTFSPVLSLSPNPLPQNDNTTNVANTFVFPHLPSVADGLNASTVIYNQQATMVYPLLTLFMPAINSSREEYSNDATANLNCVRHKSFAPGSSTPPALPAPAPVMNSGAAAALGWRWEVVLLLVSGLVAAVVGIEV